MSPLVDGLGECSYGMQLENAIEGPNKGTGPFRIRQAIERKLRVSTDDRACRFYQASPSHCPAPAHSSTSHLMFAASRLLNPPS